MEGWPELMNQIVDGNTADKGPQYEGYGTIKIYIIGFIIVGAFFFMNLFIGVMFDEYTTQAYKEKNSVTWLNNQQEAWLKLQPMIYNVKINFDQLKKPTNCISTTIYKFVNHSLFEVFIFICIIVNIIIMASVYEGSRPGYKKNLALCN